MGSQNKYNIFWFIIDSVRTFRTGLDDRDWLDIMDEFSKDSISFINAFTSAPSSRLAAGALFTGLPSVFIARHYNDWKFSDNKLSTIATLVNEYGYTSYPLLDTRNGRERYQFILPLPTNKILPKGYRLSDYTWRNAEITYIFEHILKNKIPKSPVCFTLWYDCRRDIKTSEHVARALELVRDYGYYDNSIIIMNSDHGYPDPATNLNESFFGCGRKDVKALGHDMVLTDDNIKTPLLLKYPGSPTNVKIPNVVGHIDIIPTIFDLLNIPRKEIDIKFQGKSLIPIIRGQEKDDPRIIRSDTRLAMDVGKITSYRSSRYKYIYFHDENYEVMYDLSRDLKELNNLLEDEREKYIDELKQYCNLQKDYEKELFRYHQAQLHINAKKSFAKLQKKYSKQNIRILVVSKAPEELLRILTGIIKDLFNDYELELLYSGNQDLSNLKVNKIYSVNDFTVNEISKLKLKKYSTVIYLTENSQRVFLRDELIKGIKSISATYYHLLNFNFELFNYFMSKWFPPNARLFFDWERKGYFYKQEPLYFVKDIIWFVKEAFAIIFSNKNKDIMAAKEILEFRDFHLKTNKSGLDEMTSSQMEHEFKRIKTRENN